MVPRPTNAGIYPPNDLRHLSSPSQFVSLASATVQLRAAKPTIREATTASFAWQPPCPLPGRVPKRATPLRHFIPNPPTSFRPFSNTTKQQCRDPLSNATASTEHLYAGPLHCRRRRRTCRILLALLPPNVLPKSRRARVSADPRQTAAHYLHASDNTRSNRGAVLGSRLSCRSHRLAMLPTDSKTAAIPSIWLGWLPRHRHRSILHTALPSRASRIHPPSPPPPWRSQCRRRHHPLPSPPIFRRRSLGNNYRSPDTAGHLEIATTLSLTVWLILLSTNVGAPTTPSHCYPGPNHPAFPRPPTVPPASVSVYPPAYTGQRRLFRLPQLQQTPGLSFPTLPLN